MGGPRRKPDAVPPCCTAVTPRSVCVPVPQSWSRHLHLPAPSMGVVLNVGGVAVPILSA